MAFERWPMWHSQTMQSHDEATSVYSLHPTFHSLHLIVIEPQMWGWASMADCGRTQEDMPRDCHIGHFLGTEFAGFWVPGATLEPTSFIFSLILFLYSYYSIFMPKVSAPRCLRIASPTSAHTPRLPYRALLRCRICGILGT